MSRKNLSCTSSVGMQRPTARRPIQLEWNKAGDQGAVEDNVVRDMVDPDHVGFSETLLGLFLISVSWHIHQSPSRNSGWHPQTRTIHVEVS